MTDYTEFDAELLSLLAGGLCSFAALAERLSAKAAVFCTEPRQVPFRVVDRRLQALRKKGLVSHNTKTGWNVAKP